MMNNTTIVSSTRYFIVIALLLLVVSSCSIEKKISRSADSAVLQAPALQAAHVGISVYEPATGKYWFNYQGDKYFVPASNTKIPTCYAAMKYLGDSLIGLRYRVKDGEYILEGTGDPTFLLAEYRQQPVYDFLVKIAASSRISMATNNWKDKHWGSGWGWSDYDETYMAERSPFPVYGNVVKFTRRGQTIYSSPATFNTAIVVAPGATPDSASLQRGISTNEFRLEKSNSSFRQAEMPYVTNGYEMAMRLLNDTLRPRQVFDKLSPGIGFTRSSGIIHSQPTDSLLKPMMHRSDNFFAEQSLLMVSNELLGFMNDARVIDTLLQTDFKDLPQKPRWVDGSGLSRYNLFTPQDMVAILNKMRAAFGMTRIKTVFATGGEGTISSYYKSDSGYIFAKTGTLAGVVALSGFLTTKNNKELIFSVLVNNHQGSATDVRRAVEKFIQGIRNNY